MFAVSDLHVASDLVKQPTLLSWLLDAGLTLFLAFSNHSLVSPPIR